MSSPAHAVVTDGGTVGATTTVTSHGSNEYTVEISVTATKTPASAIVEGQPGDHIRDIHITYSSALQVLSLRVRGANNLPGIAVVERVSLANNPPNTNSNTIIDTARRPNAHPQIKSAPAHPCWIHTTGPGHRRVANIVERQPEWRNRRWRSPPVFRSARNNHRATKLRTSPRACINRRPE